jgi:splicing factor 3B subunit 4
MNGQYLSNKEVSVQYAYKKDGKGERHGDEAERMLASQAKKHNMLPDAQQMPAQLLLNGNVPTGPSTGMLDNSGMGMAMGMGMNMGMNGPPPSLPPGFGGRPAPGNYNNVPPPQQQQRPNGPLPTAPSGLPQRPPPSQAGYGGPQEFHPPGFAPPPGFQNQQAMPPGFGAPPPGFMPPPGFAPPQQAPPGYAGRR